MTKPMTKTQAQTVAHTLGKPSKMPGKAYGIPAAECAVGSKLRHVEGSVCSKCYALKGRYSFDNVTKAQYKRLDSIDKPDWVPAMVALIGKETWFRWHDSGDIQSVSHLAKIAMIAVMTPDCNHWLPTKEKGMVKQYLKDGGTIPDNLNIRISGAMIDGKAPQVDGCTTSTVDKDNAPIGHACPAPSQGGECKTCRACWSKDVANVSYHVH